MPNTEFGCLPTIIGSMPDTDPAEACALVNHYLKDIPAWPQLPKRSFRENMYVQFSEGFPGVVIEDDKIFVDRSQDLDKPLEKLYAAYLNNDFDKYPVSAEYAAGLHSFLSLTNLSPLAVKGQIPGPVTWGIIPNQAESLTKETVVSLEDRLEEVMVPFARKDIRFKQLIEQGLLTPSCTLTSLSEEVVGQSPGAAG